MHTAQSGGADGRPSGPQLLADPQDPPAGSTWPGAETPNGAGSGQPKAKAAGSAQAAAAVRLRLRAFRWLLRRIVRWTHAVARVATRLIGEGPGAGREHITEAELRDLVARSTALDRDERKLIDEVITTGDRTVRELMVPRTEVVFLDAAMSLAEAVAVTRHTPHSRFPVMDTNRDDVIGFVHLRDLLLRPAGDAAATVGDVAREVRRLPGTKPILAALSEMRRAGDHLAIVADEYGGTAGIVTLEDLIEELVGEIHDEYDETPKTGSREGCVPEEVDGLLNLADFAERVGFALPPGPYQTVGGFVMAALGRLAVPGDHVTVAGAGRTWRLEALELDGRRIARVGLRPLPEAPSAVVASGEEAEQRERVADKGSGGTEPATPPLPPPLPSPASAEATASFSLR